jgi:hypothetical protein
MMNTRRHLGIGLLSFVVGVVFILSAQFVVAQTSGPDDGTRGGASQGGYQLLTNIPGFQSASDAGSFTELINVIYKVAIALSIAVAVVVLVVEGVRYSASDIPGVKADIKNRIPLVIGGMVLLIAAYMLLELINPQLVNLEDLTGTGTVPDNSGLSGISGVDAIEVGMPDSTDPGGIDVQPYVWVSEDEEGESDATLYETQEECQEATGESCTEIYNTSYESTYDSPPNMSDGMLYVSPDDSNYTRPLTQDVVGGPHGTLADWPANPYRTPRDFADCKKWSPGGYVPTATREVRISARTVANDAYINQILYQAGIIDSPLPINSAYRSNPGDQGPCVTEGTGKNHPYYESLDLSISGLTQEEREMLLNLLLDMGVCRMGFGSNYMHIQWNAINGADCAASGFDNGSNTYWCYGNIPGPYSGRGIPGYAKGQSCNY